MANTIPCPNPTCPHDFTAAELQAGRVQCPKCGFRLQGQGAAAPAKAAPAKSAPPPAKPLAKASKPAIPVKPPAKSAPKPVPTPAPKPAPPATAKVIMATPVAADAVQGGPVPMASPIASAAPVAPVAPPQESAPPASDFAGTGPLVRMHKPARKVNWHRALMMVLIVGFSATIVVVVIPTLVFFLLRPGNRSEVLSDGTTHTGSIRNQKDVQEIVYKLSLPKLEWAIETEIRTKLGAHTAWKSTEEDFWFAIVVKDYDMFKPRDAEMLRQGIAKLENYYGEALELDSKTTGAKVAGIPAQKLRFKGQVSGASWLGDCYMFSLNGVGYWLYVASPDAQTLDSRTTDLLGEKVFTAVSERRDWREQDPPKENFRTDNKKLTMTALRGIWEAAKDPKNIEEKGELVLVGYYRDEKDNRKNGHLLIYTMEKKADLKEAMKAAREHLENKVKSDDSGAKLEKASEVSEGQGDLGKESEVGDRRGRMMDLKKLQLGEEPARYYLLVVVNEPDMCYVIQCNCIWEHRQLWRQDFLDLMRTIRFGK
jgi:hypothetical protein